MYKLLSLTNLEFWSRDPYRKVSFDVIASQDLGLDIGPATNKWTQDFSEGRRHASKAEMLS